MTDTQITVAILVLIFALAIIAKDMAPGRRREPPIEVLIERARNEGICAWCHRRCQPGESHGNPGSTIVERVCFDADHTAIPATDHPA